MTVIGILQRPREQAMGPSTAAIVAIEKLTESVVDETRALRAGGAVDLERFTHAKNYGLLEVTRAMRTVPQGAADPSLVSRLRFLRDRLEENRRALGLHLAAAEEIANLVSGTMEEAASDGTYSAAVMRGRTR